MHAALGFVIYLIAFAMLFAGIGLLIGGEITFKSGKKIPKASGRKAAAALVGFIPLFVILRTILRWLGLEETVPVEAISWPLMGACLVLAGTWLLRGMAANKPRPSYTRPASVSPFETNEATPAVANILPEFDMPPQPPPEAPVARPASSKRRGKDPFDFS